MGKKTILLVDDDDISNILNQMIITIVDPEATVIVFSNAVDALVYLKENQENKQALPDFILLDINMPIMDGWQFAKKCLELNHPIKIVVLSSSDDEDDMNKIADFGNIVKYVIKPMSVEHYTALSM